MTGVTGPLSPYITPEMLITAPTGISWSTIPAGSGVTPAMRIAEQTNLCARATAQADKYCNQLLRATLDTEIVRGPNFRATIQVGSRNGRIILSRWPVTGIVNVMTAAANQWPHQWITVPTGLYEPEVPVLGIYGSSAPSDAAEGGQAIIVAPGVINWGSGRQGTILQVQYYNGWPHTGMTVNSTAGDTTIQVDDCTAWAITTPFSNVTGAIGTFFDSGQQEVATVTQTSVTTGPGTLTLALPLTYAHQAGTLFSTIPQSVTWGCILFAAAMALARGATSTTVQSIPGGAGGGSAKPADFIKQGEALLAPFRRVI
jgi:hypothetical protein